MSSGGTRLKTNLRERPVSPDLNRLQDLAAADLANLLRYLHDSRGDFTIRAGGEESTPGTLGTPLRALVIAGLRPAPVGGTVDLTVTPGALLASSPDASPGADDSPYKYVVDAGVPAVGSLVLTPNGAGTPRVDVLECRVVDALVASETRDVFDLATGVFPPGGALVEKVRSRRLEYRIRLGTAGAGFPGSASGWLPLMVISAPLAAAVWDDCVFWDVRPLLNDLLYPTGMAVGVAFIEHQLVSSEVSPFSVPATNLWLRGQVDAQVSGARFRAGGYLDASGGDEQRVDVLDAANHDATATPFVADQPWYLWAAFPFGLPRWARYSNTNFTIGDTRGILLVSQTGTASQVGGPDSTLLPPAALGLGGAAAASTAALLCAGLVGDAVNKVWAIEVDGRVTRHLTYATVNSGTLRNPDATDPDSARWDLLDGTDIPANSRAVTVEFTGTTTVMVTGGFIRRRVGVRDTADAFDYFRHEDMVPVGSDADPGVNHTQRFEVRLPLEATITGSLPGLKTRRITWEHELNASTGGTMTSARMRILSWEIGT